MVEPLIVSWGYHVQAEFVGGSQFVDYLSYTGTKDPAAALTVPAAIRFMQEHDWERVRQDCHQLLRATLERICILAGMPALYPLESDLYVQMGIAPLPSAADTTILKQRLYDEFRVEVPLIEWNGKKFVRVSIQAYNTAEDADALVEGLRILLPQVQV